ncbi:MAG: hypothetical protein KA354_22310 [Phycisphaerae bacterium]|nr:hypothetical protein [Phycisphaerae bacterium]
MGPHKPTGWNTWDFRGFNRMVFLRNGKTEVVVQYAIWDEHVPPPSPDSRKLGHLHDTLRWSDVRKLGPHGPLGLPARLEFAIGESVYRAEATDTDGELRLTVSPLGVSGHRVVFLLLAPVGETVRVKSATSGSFAHWRVSLENATWPTDYFLNIAEPYAAGKPGRLATLILTPSKVTRALAGSFEAYERTALAGRGELADAPEAMMHAVSWNTLYDTRRGLLSSPVSRDWCYDWRGVLVFCWDTFLVGTMVSSESRQLARSNFEAVTAAIEEFGMVPNYFMAHGAVSMDRSMPPLGAYMIWKTEQFSPDLEWVKGIYPRLRKWHTYWMTHRDGNGDGLLEWGTDATPRYEFPQLLPYNPSLQHTAKCAMYESGLDNSPMYDDVPFNEKANTFELADVGLNSYYAMDCEALARLAERLGRPKEAAAYRKEYEAVRERINAQLWDEEHGLYANRHWDGRFSRRWSPTSFFPLIAGVADPSRGERMVKEHLLNEKEFWGRYVVPAIARTDPAYPDNDYWRGRIWGPFNFLLAEGLRRYRMDDVAAELAGLGLTMFMENWRKDGGVYENYNADTGAGGDVWNAARLYHWGGLMAFIAIQELIDAEATGALRFGSLRFPDAGIHNMHIGEDIYDVDLNDGVRVKRNGNPFVDCTCRAIVRIPVNGEVDAPIDVTVRPGVAGILTLHKPPEPVRRVRVTGGPVVGPTTTGDCVKYTW